MFRPRLLAFLSLLASAYGLISKLEFETNSAKGLRLLSLQEGEDPVWMTEDQKLKLMVDDVNFFDVTETYNPGKVKAATNGRTGALVNSLSFQAGCTRKRREVVALLAQVSESNSRSWLASIAAYNTRFYKSEDGVGAALWIKESASLIALDNPESRASVAFFPHGAFAQNSVIATIPGSNPALPRVIIGAHLDSVNGANPLNGTSPGADDNGSGCVNLLEAFRVLVSSRFKPSATVEFHWYAGEEAGLLGSQDIAKQYHAQGVNVKAMINFDMTGFFRPGSREVIALVPDYVNPDLNAFLGRVIKTYLSLPWVKGDPCHYACSDHASWHELGYPAAYPFEALDADMNIDFHTTNDTFTAPGWSWGHLLEFTKLAVAALYELAI